MTNPIVFLDTEIVDQPPPIARPDVPSVQAMVRADLDERERIGVERYGTPLQPHNGRNPLVDAYQEALDLACYLRQAIAEERGDALTRARAEIARLKRCNQHNADLVAELRLQVDRRVGVPREINTPEVRQAITAALADAAQGNATEVDDDALGWLAAAVFRVLDRASAGQPLDGCPGSTSGRRRDRTAND